MKKTVRGLTITAIVLMIVGAVMFGVTPKLMAISGSDAVYGTHAILNAFPQKAMALFQPPFGLASWVTFGMLGFILILFIVHIIVICANKRPSGLAVAIFFLLFGLGATCLAILVFTPNYIASYKGVADEGTVPFIRFLIGCYKAEDVKLPIYWLIAIFAEMGLVVLGFIFFVIADITDMVYLGQSPKAIKRDYAKQSAKSSDIVVVRDDSVSGSGVTPEEIRDIMHAEMSQASSKPAAAEAEYQGKSGAPVANGPIIPPTSTAISGPLLVQYINTYSPSSKDVSGDKRSSVPLSEIQENVTGEKSLKAEDIRKIVKEELDAQKKEASSQPLIVTVPAPANEESKESAKQLTPEDISAIISEELKGYLGKEEKKEEGEEPVIVEPAPEPELSAEDIRSIIREELAAEKKAAEEEAAARKAEEDKKAAEEKAAKEAELRHQREIEEAKEKAAAEARAAAIAEANRAAEEEAARKEAEARAEEERKNALTAEQIRQIIAEELGRKEEAKEETPAALSAEDIRSIIAEELKTIKANEQKQPSAPVTIIVREPLDRQESKKEVVAEPAPVVEEPKEEPLPVKEEPAPVKEEEPTPEPVVETKEEVVEEPVEEPAEEPVAEETSEEDDEPKKRVVGQVNPNLPPHEKIVRIPFQDRMETADEELRSHYNELKSEAMSYGVKSRVSNSGDTFRLHKVTFLKITIAGKGLKLYFALDPKDYASTTLPIQDAGHKGTYKDIPLVFKVKSDLSFRRAKQLIADVMAKNNLTQGEIEKKDWAADLKNAASSEDESDED